MMNKIALLINASQASLRLFGPVNFTGNDVEGLTAMNYKVAKLWSLTSKVTICIYMILENVHVKVSY